MERLECVKFATAQKFKIENFTCLDLQYSGINESTIKDKIAAKDSSFFSDDYLLFLANPEEAGASFVGQGISSCSDIDFDLLRSLNTLMTELEPSVKELMVNKLDNFMVGLLLSS